MASKKWIERITARVFCHHVEGVAGGGGGNPLTIFSSKESLLSSTKKQLAQDCSWESVFVTKKPTSNNNKKKNVRKPIDTGCINRNTKSSKGTVVLPELSFYMPSGEEVNFCAHAAMGACLELGNLEDTTNNTAETDTVTEDEDDDDDNSTNDNDNDDFIEFMTRRNTKKKPSTKEDAVGDDDDDDDDDYYSATLYDGDIVALDMNDIVYEETKICHLPTLCRILRDYLNLQMKDIVVQTSTTTTTSSSSSSKTMVANESPYYESTMHNASIVSGRWKTLIYVNSMEVLQQTVTAPKQNLSNHYEQSCVSGLNNSTGIYCFAKRDEDDSWECRQFPKSSGYSEDPATGIAAAALAISLHRNGIVLPSYKMYQGTAMGKPSLIVIDQLQLVEQQQNQSQQNQQQNLNQQNQQQNLNQQSSSFSSSSSSSSSPVSSSLASFRILGRVEVDHRDTLQISEDK